MNGALVVILALLWALVLVPGAIRSRRSSPTSSVGTFERAMDVLARRDQPGRVLYVPGDAGAIVGDRTLRRRAQLDDRRRRFTRMVAATLIGLPIAIVGEGRWWFVFFVPAVALGVYIALLLRWKAQAEQAATVVRTLPLAHAPAREIVLEPDSLFGDEDEDDEADEIPGLLAVGSNVRIASSPSAFRQTDSWPTSTAVRVRRWED